MTWGVIAVDPELNVQAVVRTLLGNGISAVPVIDHDCKLLGIISEGDLMRRVETGTERRRSWWQELFTTTDAEAMEFVRSHARKAKDVMTSEVITATPDTPLEEIASLLERHHIKRIPIVEDGGQMVGIVSRANLLEALAARSPSFNVEVDESDAALQREIEKQIEGQPWAARPISIIAHDGTVDLWGFVHSEAEKDAIRVAAESTPGVHAVNDNLRVWRDAEGY
jgi:CBS domain-containing protein